MYTQELFSRFASLESSIHFKTFCESNTGTIVENFAPQKWKYFGIKKLSLLGWQNFQQLLHFLIHKIFKNVLSFRIDIFKTIFE